MPTASPMMRALGRIGAILLFALIALLLAPIVVPPFLDRIYYRGPVSDHFNGERFFNPDGESGAAATSRRAGRMIGFLLGKGRVPWPATVPVTPTKPAARVADLTATWIGHSTVLVQAAGLNILTDPIWADRSGPFGLTGPRRVRAPGVRFEDLPRIDLILVSHDHYDHMDLATLKRLWTRDHPKIVTSLGNDTVIANAGVPAIARDWGESVAIRPGVRVIVERVHHWGTRWTADRNRALWSGFTIVLPGGNLFFAGDTGWGDGSWPADAARDGPYRLAILPIGAFRPRDLMQGNHIGPAEAVEAFRTLGASSALGVHWGTFQLSAEAIDEPPTLLAHLLAGQGIAPGRFRTLAAGQPWAVPPIGQNGPKALESTAQK